MLVALLVLLALSSAQGIVTPDAPSGPVSSEDAGTLSGPSMGSQNAELTQDEPPPGDAPVAEKVVASSTPERIHEPDEPKADADLADEDVDPLLDVPSGLFEVVDADSLNTRKRQNYASLDAGATILDAAADTKSPTNLLVPDKDRYMLTPCSNPRKWVVISLSEDVHADAIAVANYEKFSSPVKDFIVLGSVNYPTDTWLVLGNFTAAHTNGEQIFQLDSQQHVRYIKFRFLSHYGSEYYCTLSQLRVFGRTFTQVISQLEKSIDAEVEALDAIPALPVSPLPDSGEVSVPRIPDPAELMSQCLMEKNNTVAAVFYDGAQRTEHYRSHGMCCLVDYTPEQIEAEVAANANSIDPSTSTNTEPTDAEVVDGTVQSTGPSPSNTPSTGTNTTSVPGAGGPSSNTSTASSSTSATASLLPATHNGAASSLQGLGRLESIFVRITKKIQGLEVNQSVMARQLEEFHTHQWAAIKMLQANQESLNDQLKDIRSMLVDLKDHVAKELATNEQTLLSYRRVLDDVRRDNIALWNELLIVREVITTMKAGILCAIVLSGFIILFYLLRLLFRCVSKCKERADLREWFWRMENHESSSDDNGDNAVAGNVIAGSLHVNRKAQFGSSWDDSAIERKTLVSDMPTHSTMSRSSSFSSGSDVNFDDLDDQQVFGLLGDDDDPRPSRRVSRSRSPSADFRLDFSSRISSRAPPPPLPAVASSKPAARKSVATTKPRSPSLTPKKRIVKRSSLTISTPTSKLFSQKRDSSVQNVFQTSASRGSHSDLFLDLVPAAPVELEDAAVSSRRTSKIQEAVAIVNSKLRKAKPSESTGGSGSVATLGNANALVAALASLQTQVELLTSEKSQLEDEVATARTTIENLEQKVAASEQSSDLFAVQLANVKESFQAKLMAREEEVSLERMTLTKEKETQLQQQQARFTTEAELWKHEIAALTKVKLELESDNERLSKELSDEALQRGLFEVKHGALKAEHARTTEELQMLLQERDRFEQAQVEIQKLQSQMTENQQDHERQRQQLQDRESQLLLEKDEQAAEWERERHLSVRRNGQEKAKLLRFVQEVRDLHHLLHVSVTEARELFNVEVKKTKDALGVIQQQASEFAVLQSDREVALMSRKGRILQLETQLKNDRQTINQLEATLAKSTRVLENKLATLKTKFQEQKEHLEITLAVRQGLTTDLHAKRQQVADLEREVRRLSLANAKAEVKRKHSQQQILAMQKLHTKDLEKYKKLSSTGRSKVEYTPLLEENVRAKYTGTA
ncbi:SUN domain-containing protein 4 [Phytophthora citrophthora]|uniref:SUN domain-containing protein 4 n=1 Tax=Phytophthora citrophthora TaxID=4793 RepID=A0AAD9LBB6_9STRA|nr:SUN domain-containing protein 4 [Phytophthora citrophthora]